MYIYAYINIHIHKEFICAGPGNYLTKMDMKSTHNQSLLPFLRSAHTQTNDMLIPAIVQQIPGTNCILLLWHLPFGISLSPHPR